jgi:hypothetical protein
LNIIGNKTLKPTYSTTDYFEKNDAQVHNDLFPQILKTEFNAYEYLNLLDVWFQEGIIFHVNQLKATNVLVQSDYVQVAVEIDRTVTVPSKGFRDRQSLVVLTRFPILADAKVGLERITPRIYKIDKRPVKINPKNYIQAGFNLSAMNYFGDLNPANRSFTPETSLTRPNFGLHFTKKINPYAYLRLGLNYGRILGDDARAADPTDYSSGIYRYLRNLHFRNSIFEISAVGIFDILPNKGEYYKRKNFTPYIMAGIALFHHQPEAKEPAEFGGQWVKLRDLGTEGQGRTGYDKKYGLWQAAIPLGIGVKYRLNSRIDFSFEMGVRYMFFDYLDDVSKNYPDLGDLDNNFQRNLSNRTLEPTAALTGQSRLPALNKFLLERNAILTYTGTDGTDYTIVNGFGRKGDQRGSPKSNDLYVLTGFHLSYLLRVGKQQDIPGGSGIRRPKVKGIE